MSWGAETKHPDSMADRLPSVLGRAFLAAPMRGGRWRTSAALSTRSRYLSLCDLDYQVPAPPHSSLFSYRGGFASRKLKLLVDPNRRPFEQLDTQSRAPYDRAVAHRDLLAENDSLSVEASFPTTRNSICSHQSTLRLHYATRPLSSSKWCGSTSSTCPITKDESINVMLLKIEHGGFPPTSRFFMHAWVIDQLCMLARIPDGPDGPSASDGAFSSLPSGIRTWIDFSDWHEKSPLTNFAPNRSISSSKTRTTTIVHSLKTRGSGEYLLPLEQFLPFLRGSHDSIRKRRTPFHSMNKVHGMNKHQSQRWTLTLVGLLEMPGFCTKDTTHFPAGRSHE
ncbi:hypothetical protein IWZ00DRAFT_488540 [Phyllosticta capitalensis]